MSKEHRLEAMRDFEEAPIKSLVQCMPNSCLEVCNSPGAKKLKLKMKNRKRNINPLPPSKRTSIENRCLEEKYNEVEESDYQLIAKNTQYIQSLLTQTPANVPKTVESETLSETEVVEKAPHDQSHVLGDIIKKHKINSIVRNFIKKVKRVAILKDPIEMEVLQEFDKSPIYHKKGIQLPLLVENMFTLLSILQILFFTFIFSIGLVYTELQQDENVSLLEGLTLMLILVEILVNLFTIKHHSGKKLQTLIDIWKAYLHDNLTVDLLSAFFLAVGLMTSHPAVHYFKMIILLKLPQCMQKVERLEVYFIKNLYNEQYWSLIKILLFNFFFAHFISILLAGMVQLSPGSNWMTVKHIENADWVEKYCWSYYWANTIMLTVGFGDLVASNYQEAICLVFIQTFSCMAFAYNINIIGGLIQQIGANDAERSQRSKIFTKLTSKNKLSEELSYKINNYIEETARLRKIFDYEEERQFISSLPIEMKKDYLKQSNKKIFIDLDFFKSFVSKTLYNLAEKIQMRVSHPEEVIQHLNDDYNLMILKSGSLGFVSKNPNSSVQSFVMDELKVEDKPMLVNLDFIPRKRSLYQIKSMEYSVFYFLSYEKFVEVLRQTDMDYQFFCTMRDRMKIIPDQFEVMNCRLCKGKHLKSLCPKLHYIPYQENIIHKYMHCEKRHKNNRASCKRMGRGKGDNCQSAFVVYHKSMSSIDKLSTMVQIRKRGRSERDNQFNDDDISEVESKGLRSFTELEKSVQDYRATTIEMFKVELIKINKSETLEDEVWALKSDLLQNYNAYFPEHNPTNIENIYSQMQLQPMHKAHASLMIQLLLHPSHHGQMLKSTKSSKSSRVVRQIEKDVQC